MLKDKDDVPEINMKAYMKACHDTRSSLTTFWDISWIPPISRCLLLLKCGLPGGMMGSMMADLKGDDHAGINILKSKTSRS